ncbi:MAG: vWA domain-containing protein [Actinomycetota bacterium]
MTTSTTRNTHIYFVLDRSGSMQTIVSDVIGGFNSYIAQQALEGSDALITFIQFDSQDSHHVVFSALPVTEVRELTSSSFVPRGATPLYDAMGHAIASATIRAEQVKNQTTGEDIVFVTFTDGEENDSIEYDRKKIFTLIKKREKLGWTFVYLGANQDAYGEADLAGFDKANVSNFVADAAGTQTAFDSLSKATSMRRARQRSGQKFSSMDFFEGDKAADLDAEQRAK